MKRQICPFLLAGMLFVIPAVCASAGEVRAKLKLTSAHLWRGWTVNDEPCFQPSATIKSGSFGFNVWGTMDLAPDSDSPRRTRLDATGYYETGIGKQILSGGIIGYFYQDEPVAHAMNTGEIFLGYALNTVLVPSMTMYYDFQDIGGYYASFTVAHSIEFDGRIPALDAQLSLGGGSESYADSLLNFGTGPDGEELYEPDDETLINLTLRVSAPIELGRNIRLVPGARYMRVIDHDARQAADEAGEETDIIAAVVGLEIRGKQRR